LLPITYGLFHGIIPHDPAFWEMPRYYLYFLGVRGACTQTLFRSFNHTSFETRNTVPRRKSFQLFSTNLPLFYPFLLDALIIVDSHFSQQAHHWTPVREG
jgi:hypothetical protein